MMHGNSNINKICSPLDVAGNLLEILLSLKRALNLKITGNHIRKPLNQCQNNPKDIRTCVEYANNRSYRTG